MDSLAAHMAVLDTEGQILITNRAWQAFGEKNGLHFPLDCAGINYLDICDTARGKESEEAQKAADGIRKVLCGKIKRYFLEYSFEVQEKIRHFLLTVVPVHGMSKTLAIVSHEDITVTKKMEEILREREKDLSAKAQELDETNTALKVLLTTRDRDRQEMERNILSNISLSIQPALQKLSSLELSPQAKRLSIEIEENMRKIASPLLKHLTTLSNLLTPQEYRIATLVRDGKSTKEIAEHLNLSLDAVHFHRRNLRKKLGLTHSGQNLRSFIHSLED